MEGWLLLAAIICIGVPVLLIWLWVSVVNLRARVTMLEARAALLARAPTPDAQTPDAAPPLTPETAPIASHEEVQLRLSALSAAAEKPSGPQDAAPLDAAPPDAASQDHGAPDPAAPPPPPPHPPAAPPLPADPWRWEKLLTERWLVWLGGVALALAAAFLVKQAIDEGLLGPVARCVLGAAFGGFLLWGGDRVTRKGEAPDAPIPASLIGAGVSALFASLWAARALYDLLPAPLALVGLGAVAFGGVIAALRHGQWVGLLGLVGAFAAPVLVNSHSGDVNGLVGYLLVTTAGALTVARRRPWPFFIWLTCFCVSVWTLIWREDWPNSVVSALGALVVLGLYARARLGADAPNAPALAPASGAARIWRHMHYSAGVAALMVALALFNAFGQEQTPLNGAALIAAFVGLALYGYRWPEAAPGALAPLAVTLLALAMWRASPPVDPRAVINDVMAVAPIGPDLLYGLMAAATAVFSGLFGAFAAHRAPLPWAWGWAGVSALVPYAVLLIGYSLRRDLFGDAGWTALALAQVAAQVAAAEATRRRRDQPGQDYVLGGQALAAAAGLGLAAAILLEQGWLTLALAVIAPATVWVARAVGVPALLWAAPIALLLSLIVQEDAQMAWLLTDKNFLAYGTAAQLFLAPLLAGATSLWGLRGAPPAYNVWATRSLGGLTLWAGAMLAAAWGGAFIRYGWAGPELLQVVGRGLSWVVLGLAWIEAKRRWGGVAWASDAAIDWVIRGLIGVGLGSCVAGCLAVTGRLSWNDGHPVLSSLMLTALLPALLSVAIQRRAADGALRAACRWSALGFFFVWGLLEIRYRLGGGGGRFVQPELYAYTAWGLFCGASLWLASRRLDWGPGRKLGLGLLLLTTAKVFLIDLSFTKGLWRTLAFLVLGAVLIGLGLVIRRKSASPPADDTPKNKEEP